MSQLAGTGGLVRLILRRDRFLLPLWLLIVLTVLLGRAATARDTYPTAAARQDRFDQVAEIPMFMLAQSRAFATDLGALVAQEAFGGMTLAAAFGAILIVARHTRSEEQSGRRELLGATVVGRHAPLTAVLAVVWGAGVLLALVGTAGLVGVGLPVAGSFALAFVACAAVWVSAGLAAILVQVTESARLAVAVTFLAMYLGHLVRGISAVGGDELAWLGWLTPNGWLENVRPFAGERWWALLLAAGFALAFAGVGYALSVRRDLAGGLVPARPAAAEASPRLRGAFGLAWRLHRGMVLGWAFVIAICGLGLGYAGGTDAMRQYAQGAWLQEYARAMGASPSAAFFVYVAFLLGLVVSFHAVLTTLRMRTEESQGYAEAVLATPVSRARWAASHLAFAAGSPVVLLAILGLGAGLGAGLASGDIAGDVARMLGVTFGMAPAMWVMVGVTLVAFGLFGRASVVIAWAALAVVIVAELAVHWGLPEWVFRTVSPFAHVNPFYDQTPVTYVVLTLVAGALVAAGLGCLRRRDIAP